MRGVAGTGQGGGERRREDLAVGVRAYRSENWRPSTTSTAASVSGTSMIISTIISTQHISRSAPGEQSRVSSRGSSCTRQKVVEP